jgi:hypothetical protein
VTFFFLVVRNPPYEYVWTWRNAWNSPTVRTTAASRDGNIDVYIFTNTSGPPSSADARGHVGIFFRPSASGMYSFSVSPAVFQQYFQAGALAGALTLSWAGILV